MQETHRPGNFKQKNKPHKTGRHRSKGEINATAKGKVCLKLLSRKSKIQQHKHDRRNQANLLRIKKREDTLIKKRQIGGSATPPIMTAIIPLELTSTPEKIINLIMEADHNAISSCSAENIFHLSIPRWKQRFSFLIPSKESVYAALDAVKVSDAVVFVLSAKCTDILNEETEKLLTCILSQGLPTAAVVILDLETLPLQKRFGYKQEVQKALSRWLPNEKIFSLEKDSDALMLLRKLGSQKQRPIHQRECRPYLLVEQLDLLNGGTCEECDLKVSGYLRGQNLSVNSLVHIPSWGDFQMVQIESALDPHSFDKNSREFSPEILQVADPRRQTILQSENVPDPMDAEQTWPTEDELKEAKRATKTVRKVPLGTSEYQACWIVDEEPFEDDCSESEDISMRPDSEEESDAWEAESSKSPLDVEESDQYDDSFNKEEEMEALITLRAAREEASFPDEVDTPQDVPARERFSKYRGLASFRTSPWDPKENLPPEYGRIFQFENFTRTKNRIIKELQEQVDGVFSGAYVSIVLKNVPVKLVEERLSNEPIIVCGLLPHEHQMSIINLVVKRSNHPSYSQLPIKSKDPVVVHCGFRRYCARPIYSQHTNGSKHKYERFFQPETTVVATLYAPITYPPASVLLFTERGATLLATGRVLSVNPDRLIIKRVILSGHPYRVLKHSAIIRFMFFNREDIEWFKPVELRTKYGRRGHIKEPLGTHGHMKAVFDDQLKSQDTVLMTLYKRVFPPWSYEARPPKPPPLISPISNNAMEV